MEADKRLLNVYLQCPQHVQRLTAVFIQFATHI